MACCHETLTLKVSSLILKKIKKEKTNKNKTQLQSVDISINT